MKIPDPNSVFPVKNCKTVTNIKPTLKNEHIVAGDYSYFSDVFFSKHVTHRYDFYGDKLIIGKFCQIAAGVNFTMNGANHQMNCATTFPFYMTGWEQEYPSLKNLQSRGDTVVGNDVWIGENVTVMPGVKIGDGAIIGKNSTVASDIPPYTVAAGNPAKVVRERFDEELKNLLLNYKWWDLPPEKISEIIPVLTSPDLNALRAFLKEELSPNKR